MTQLRSDALRNRGLVLEAAAQLFAERGPDVTVDEIARHAGVGHGTIFRRFPTKDALMAAVLGVRLEELAAGAEELLAHEDAWAAFEEFVWSAADACGRDRALFDGVPRCEIFPEVAEAKQQLDAIAQRLIRRAQDDGSLRGDIAADDVAALVASAMLAAGRVTTHDASRLYISIVLDGLRSAPAERQTLEKPPSRRSAVPTA